MSSLLSMPDVSLDASLIMNDANPASSMDPLLLVGLAPTSMNTVGSSPNNQQCRKCGFIGCDLRIEGCGCYLHTRCCALPPGKERLRNCPNCDQECTGIFLEPLSFYEMDEARRNRPKEKESKSKRAQNRKRKQLKDAFSNINELYDRRTGRWTQEEIDYVDELIATFEQGKLPLFDGIKLNDFLAGLLQCKQSRLTKKMKNARLSSKSYVRNTGCLEEDLAKRFGMLENSFLQSIGCAFVRAEVRFHMQKHWREIFSNYCVQTDQPIDASQWISSVEDLERRLSNAKDHARVQRRKLMMKCALNQDAQNPDPGVFIEKDMSDHSSLNSPTLDAASHVLSLQRTFSQDANDDLLMLLSDKAFFDAPDSYEKSNTVTKEVLHRSAFLAKVILYIKENKFPFEHVDVWVPSYITDDKDEDSNKLVNQQCRLCFAGCDTQILDEERSEEYHSLVSFGEYSEKFSFGVGCGMPGRVYQSGIPTWEQSVHNAPLNHFERCGGAMQWGISTVVAIPIPSPNVGRIVLILYSCKDHPKNPSIVSQLSSEFSTYLPSPKWKLVVECAKKSHDSPHEDDNTPCDLISKPCTKIDLTQESAPSESTKDSISDMIQLLGEFMPSDSHSPGAAHLSGFMSLRLMLLKTCRSPSEEDIINIMKSSYVSYCKAGRKRSDIALLLARDCMFLSETSSKISMGTSCQSPVSSTRNNRGLHIPDFQLNDDDANSQRSHQNMFDLVPIDNNSSSENS